MIDSDQPVMAFYDNEKSYVILMNYLQNNQDHPEKNGYLHSILKEE